MAHIMRAVAVFMIASTVVQAAALEVPHITKALGEKRTRQLAEFMTKDPSSMLTELREIVHSGETPAFDVIKVIKSTIEDDIMPSLQATRDASAAETADHLDAIELCSDESKARADQIAGSTQVSVNIARSAHAVCRDTQKAMYYHNLSSAESYCVELGKFIHATESLSITGMTRVEAVDYVKLASTNANMCSRSEVCELADNCTQTEEELRIKHTECTLKQRGFEAAFCTWKTELQQNCQELDRCYSTAVMKYQIHINKTEILLEKWNVETAALQKILCYCNVWLMDMDDCDNNRSQHNATQFDVCKDQTYSPDLVDHGTPADKASCPLTSVECCPGRSCFHQEYSGFSDFVEDVTACAESTTTPTNEITDVELELVLYNVDINLLEANPAVKEALVSAIKTALLLTLPPGYTADDITVTFSEGAPPVVLMDVVRAAGDAMDTVHTKNVSNASVTAHVSIAEISTVPREDVIYSMSHDTDAVEASVANQIQSVPDLGNITTGDVTVNSEAIKCSINEKVTNNTCVECPAGTTSTGNHDASGPDSSCEASTTTGGSYNRRRLTTVTP